MVPRPHGDPLDDRSRSEAKLNNVGAAVLRCLRERGGPLSFTDLTTAVFEQKQGQHAKNQTWNNGEFERMKIRLHHVDLPRLDDAGLLDYDLESRLISLRSTRS